MVLPAILRVMSLKWVQQSTSPRKVTTCSIIKTKAPDFQANS